MKRRGRSERGFGRFLRTCSCWGSSSVFRLLLHCIILSGGEKFAKPAPRGSPKPKSPSTQKTGRKRPAPPQPRELPENGTPRSELMRFVSKNLEKSFKILRNLQNTKT